MVSAGHVGDTRGSDIVSSAADALWMSVVREIRSNDRHSASRMAGLP